MQRLVLSVAVAATLLVAMAWPSDAAGGKDRGTAFAAFPEGLRLCPWPVSDAGGACVTGPMAAEPAGDLIVAVGGQDPLSNSAHSGGVEPSLWRIEAGDQAPGGWEGSGPATRITTDLRGYVRPPSFRRVTSMATSAEAVWVGTDGALLRVNGTRAEVATLEVVGMMAGSQYERLSGWPYGAQVAADGDGWVWVAGKTVVGRTIHGLPAESWRGPAHAHRIEMGPFSWAGVSACRRDRGTWVLVTKHGETRLRHVQAAAGWGNTPGERSVAPLTPEQIGSLPRVSLSQIRVATDPKGRLWIAGRNQTGVHVFVCGDNALVEKTGFADLLGGGNITDVAAGDDGKVYFATEHAGILVFDGQRWQAHPISVRLPRNEGGRLGPIQHVLPLPHERLAICTGRYLLIW